MTQAKSSIASASQYILEHVKDPALINYTRSQNAVAWKNSLSEPDYIARDHLLGRSRIASSKRNRICVFVYREKASGNIVSTVELIIRESWRFSPSAHGDVSQKQILSGCIGAVFTYPEYRRRGIAKLMVDQLMKVAKTPEYVGEDGFTFLYSEVGDYYQQCGFESCEVPLMSLPVSPRSDTHFELPPNFHFIRFHEFDDLFRLYADFLSNKLSHLVSHDGIERISIKPTADIVDWFHLRAKFLSYKLLGDQGVSVDVWNDTYEELVAKLSNIEPKFFGIKVTEPLSDKVLGFIVWTYDYEFSEKDQEFHNHATVLKIHVEDGNDQLAIALVESMKHYFSFKHSQPQLQNFHDISIWELELSETVKKHVIATHGAAHGLENSSRSAILYNNEHDNEKLLRGSMLWEENTKLPWF